MQKQIAAEYLRKIAAVFHEMSVEEIIIHGESILASVEERRAEQPPLKLVAGFDVAGAGGCLASGLRSSKNHLSAVK